MDWRLHFDWDTGQRGFTEAIAAPVRFKVVISCKIAWNCILVILTQEKSKSPHKSNTGVVQNHLVSKTFKRSIVYDRTVLPYICYVTD